MAIDPEGNEFEWFVELEGDSKVLNDLASTFKEPEITINQEENRFFLFSTTVNGSRAQVDQIMEIINGALVLSGLMPIKAVQGIGRLYKDGTRKISIAVDGRLRLVQSDWTQEQEDAERHAQVEIALIKAKLAVADEDVKEVLRLTSTPRSSWVDLYKVYEIMGKESEIVKNGWANQSDLNRFTLTANHPALSGIPSRLPQVQQPARSCTL